MKFKTIYIIVTWNLHGLYPTSKISQEGYDTYEKAVAFCSNRGDNPKQIDRYTWKSDDFKYVITEIDIV